MKISTSASTTTPRETQYSASSSMMSSTKKPLGFLFYMNTSTPLASPMKKAIESIFEEVGRFTKLNSQDDWLPITESRNGNAYYAAFHVLSSGIGFQALVLPLAFTTLGW